MDFNKIRLPAEMIDTLSKLFSKAKERNPKLDESKFIEFIIGEWLEQFAKKTPKKVLPKNEVILKNNLKSVLKYSSKSQKQIAAEIGISRAYLSQVVNGKYDPSISVVLLLMDSLEYPYSKIGSLFYLDVIICH